MILLVIAAVALANGIVVAWIRGAARRPWWEDLSDEIDSLPEADPGDRAPGVNPPRPPSDE